jgi:hypothetical protein
MRNDGQPSDGCYGAERSRHKAVTRDVRRCAQREVRRRRPGSARTGCRSEPRIVLNADVMLDVSNSPIANTTYSARVIATGVHAMSRGKTLRTLFTTGPNYVEAENNSNVAGRMRDGVDCSTLPRCRRAGLRRRPARGPAPGAPLPTLTSLTKGSTDSRGTRHCLCGRVGRPGSRAAVDFWRHRWTTGSFGSASDTGRGRGNGRPRA